MTAILNNIEQIISNITEIATLLLEFFGVIVLVHTAVKSFIQWIRHDSKLRLDLAQGIALSLEFKMGSEVLRTVVVREWEELGILAAVILLRGLLIFLIHWEVKHEKSSLQQQE